MFSGNCIEFLDSFLKPEICISIHSSAPFRLQRLLTTHVNSHTEINCGRGLCWWERKAVDGDIVVHIGAIKIVVLWMNHCINDLYNYSSMSVTGFNHIDTVYNLYCARHQHVWSAICWNLGWRQCSKQLGAIYLNGLKVFVRWGSWRW